MKALKQNGRPFSVLVIMVIAIFAMGYEIRGATLYTGDTNTSTGAWNSTRWGSSQGGPFTSGWTKNSDAIFLTGKNYTFNGAGATVHIGNITVQSNATVQFTNISNTIGTDGNVRTLTVETNAVLDFLNNNISTGAGVGFVKEGSGVLAMAGSMYPGGFTLNGGTIVLRGVNTMGGNATNVLTINGGVIAANDDRSMTNTKYGGGIFIAGDFQIGALSNNYAANAQYLINDSASISFANDVSLVGAMRTLTIGGNGNYTFSGVISNGGLTVDLATNATGRLVLSGDNTYTGGTVINSGVLQLGTNSASGSLAGSITNNGTLVIYRSDAAYSLTNAISGSGSLVKLGAQTVSLLADNTYTGDTIIGTGVLSLGDGGTSGSVTGAISMSNNTTLVINRSDNLTLSQSISNTSSGSLVKLGGGTLTLTGDNNTTFKGDVLISEGALQLGDGSANSGRIGNNAITNNSLLILNRGSGANVVNNLISGTGSVIQIFSGVAALTAENTYTGGTVISNGTLALGNGGTTGSVVGDINIAGASSILRVNRSNNIILTNEISGAGKLVQYGTGTTTLTGTNNTYEGGTIVGTGALQIGNGGTGGMIGGGVVTISNSASLIVNRGDSFVLTNSITGSGGFIHAGSGTTTLSPTNDNSFTGATTINAGTLELKAGGAALNATASVTINSGATLLLSKNNQVNDSAAITLSGGTITRASGISEIFGDLNLTAASSLDYGSGAEGTLTFGTYTPSSLLTVYNFFPGNKLVFSSDLRSDINNPGLFDFKGDFDSDWNGSTFTITAIPESPAYVVAAGLIGLMFFWPSRRRLLKDAKSILGLRPPARDRTANHT